MKKKVIASNSEEFRICRARIVPPIGWSIFKDGEEVGTLYVTGLLPPNPCLEVFLLGGEGSKRVHTEEEAVEYIVQSIPISVEFSEPDQF